MLTVISDIKTLKHTNAVNARLQNMSTLLSQLIAVQIQVKSSGRFIASQSQEKMLQCFQRNFAACNIQMLETQAAREELLERRWNFLSLLCAERIVCYIQMGKMG